MSEATATQLPPAMPGSLNVKDATDSDRLLRWVAQARAFSALIAANTDLTFDEVVRVCGLLPNDELAALDHPVGWVYLLGRVQGFYDCEGFVIVPTVH
jgi:hypothetical protein